MKFTHERRFMRLMLFFDLPTKTKSDRRVYTVFRTRLLKMGFVMVQFSVYSRVCKGQDSAENYAHQLRTIVPARGNIRVMIVTEKQYTAMQVLVGTKKKAEKIGGQQLICF